MTLKKKDIINNIAAKTGLKKMDITEVMCALEDMIYEQLSEDNAILFRNLFKIETRTVKERKFHNPITNELIEKEEHKSVKITLSTNLKGMMKAK